MIKNNKKINKLILIIVLFIATITINSSVMAVNHDDVNNNMSLYQISQLTDQVLQNYIDELNYEFKEYCSFTDETRSNDCSKAIRKLLDEKAYRINNNIWTLDYPDESDETTNPDEPDVYDSDVDYKEYEPTQTGDSEKLQTMAGKVLAIVRNAGIVIALLALTIIGIKYMVGSVEQKAEYKKTMIPFVIGVIILASGTTLVSIIYDLTTKVQEPAETVTERMGDGYEDAYNNFISKGPTGSQMYSALANTADKLASTGSAEDKVYWRGYFKALIESVSDDLENGYNACNTGFLQYNPGKEVIDSTIANYEKDYEEARKANNEKEKQYCLGYLLALGATDKIHNEAMYLSQY